MDLIRFCSPLWKGVLIWVGVQNGEGVDVAIPFGGAPGIEKLKASSASILGEAARRYLPTPLDALGLPGTEVGRRMHDFLLRFEV